MEWKQHQMILMKNKWFQELTVGKNLEEFLRCRKKFVEFFIVNVWLFQEADNVAFWLPSSESDSDEDLLSSLSSQYLLSQTDILPLVMNDGEVSLDPQPTQSTLPISPIFIASGAGTSASDQENGSKQDLMPPDLASVDLDTLLMPPEVTVKQPQENDFMVSYDFATFSALK